MRRDLGYIEGHPFDSYRRPSDIGIGEAEDRYRADYSRLYAAKIWPRVRGSIPGQGLRDSDLPLGIQSLDIGNTAALIGYAPSADKVVAGWMAAGPHGSNNELAEWISVRLGGWLPYGGGFNMERVRRLLEQYANTPKGVLSRLIDIERPEELRDQSATLALVMLWAQAVLSERLGYTIPVSSTGETAQELSDAALAGFIAAAMQREQLICDIKKGVWSLGAALFSVLAGPATVPVMLGSAAASAQEYWVGKLIDDSCKAQKAAIASIAERWRDIATPKQMVQFIRAVYAAAFNVSPESVPDDVISVLNWETLKTKSARGIAAWVIDPRNDPRLLAARNNARRDRLESISETFYGVVGCDGNAGFLNSLADRWEAAGWTASAPLVKLLKTPSPLTRYVATGAVCAPQILPNDTAVLAHPSFDYYRSITGKDAPWGVGKANRGSGTTASSTGTSAGAAIVLGTAAGATVAGPIGAVLGLAAGLLIASRK